MKNSKIINVPTLFTALNLFAGFLSVIQAATGNYASAGWLSFIASVFDALDGRIARASGHTSDFGLQMDSLGDVVSAGVAPSVLVYQFYLYQLGHTGLFLSFLPLLFAAFRLARFNLYTHKAGKKNDFTGMPAPMAAVTVASTIILSDHTQWPFLERLILLLVPLVSLLMASTLRYDGFPRFSLREKGKNRIKLIAFLATFLLLFVVPQYALFTFMMIYVVSGPVGAVISLMQNEEPEITIIPKEEQNSP